MIVCAWRWSSASVVSAGKWVLLPAVFAPAVSSAGAAVARVCVVGRNGRDDRSHNRKTVRQIGGLFEGLFEVCSNLFYVSFDHTK